MTVDSLKRPIPKVSMSRQAIGVDHFALYDSDGSAAPMLDQWRRGPWGTAQAGSSTWHTVGCCWGKKYLGLAHSFRHLETKTGSVDILRNQKPVGGRKLLPQAGRCIYHHISIKLQNTGSSMP